MVIITVIAVSGSDDGAAAVAAPGPAVAATAPAVVAGPPGPPGPTVYVPTPAPPGPSPPTSAPAPPPVTYTPPPPSQWENRFDDTLERSDQTAQYRLSQCPGEAATWIGSFVNGELPTGATLLGDTYLDGGFGAVLDGDGDHITIGPSTETVSYAASGEFSISMWFTKRECRSAGASGGSRYETLYRHTSGTERRSFGDVSPQPPPHHNTLPMNL